MNETSGLQLKVEPRSLYLQVRDQLLRLIAEEKYEYGQKIPSEQNLCLMFGVSRNTVREAIKGLVQEGVLVSRHGLGTFVVRGKQDLETNIAEFQSSTDIIRSLGYVPGTRDTRVAVEKAEASLAKRLEIAPGDPVVVIERVRTANGLKVVFVRDYVTYLDGLVELYERERPESLMRFLQGHYGFNVSYAVCGIRAITADDDLSRRLEVPAGTALLLLEQNHLTTTGKPVVYSDGYFVSKYFSFHVLRKRTRGG